MASSVTGSSAFPSKVFVLEINTRGQNTTRETYGSDVVGGISYTTGNGSFFVRLPENIPSRLACTVTVLSSYCQKPALATYNNDHDFLIRSNIQAQGASTLAIPGQQSSPYSVLVPPGFHTKNNHSLSIFGGDGSYSFYCPCGLPEVIELFPSLLNASYAKPTAASANPVWNGFKVNWPELLNGPYDQTTHTDPGNSDTTAAFNTGLFILLKIEVE